jgi:hypothetical protein
MWSKNVNEIVSTHGYSLNQVTAQRTSVVAVLATCRGQLHTAHACYTAHDFVVYVLTCSNSNCQCQTSTLMLVHSHHTLTCA